MLLLVGLGNPGPEHARNRHNVGFLAVDAIAARYRFTAFRKNFHGLIADGALGGVRTYLFKPQTYMNRSGIAVQAASQFYKIGGGNLVVIHDEIDLAAAKIKVKRGGGNAGHNGLRSLDAHIGPDYRRVRIGVGRPEGRAAVIGHVLDDFDTADKAWLDPLLEAIAEAAPLLALGDDPGFMNRVALAIKPRRATETQPSAA